MMTILIIEKNIAVAFTLIQCPPNIMVNIGVNIGESNVEHVVMDTDNATSPLASKVMTLLDVPPGHVPTNMMPIEMEGGSLNRWAITYAAPAMIMY